MLGVLKLVPVPAIVPPVGESHQLIVLPAVEVAPRFTIPFPHLAAGVVVVIVGFPPVAIKSVNSVPGGPEQ